MNSQVYVGGSLVVRTVGVETNRSGILARLSDWQEPPLFNALDARMARALAKPNPECSGG
ncbi:MAG: hypothetical protein JKY46_01930 [Robiginitomaculum sp.]|nr:hypothetical protein [Robiginitomaculum sp.]